jgi:diketogulonate reductase-like aldo/keto reductase
MNEIYPCRISENPQVFDLQISDDDVDSIDALNQDKRVGPDLDHIDF